MILARKQISKYPNFYDIFPKKRASHALHLLHMRRECQLGIDLDAKTRDDGRCLDAESIKHDFCHADTGQLLA